VNNSSEGYTDQEAIAAVGSEISDAASSVAGLDSQVADNSSKISNSSNPKIRHVSKYYQPNTSSSGTLESKSDVFDGAIPIYVEIIGSSETSEFYHPGSTISLNFFGGGSFSKSLDAWEGNNQKSTWKFSGDMSLTDLTSPVTGYKISHGSSSYELKEVHVEFYVWDLGF
jgi:hypothetical protein